jgi:biopolymer transport protein ExbD
MQFRKKNNRHAAIESGALSDILFFLMLFFLIMSTLASPNAIKLLLPKASTGQTVPKHKIELSVTADLRVYIDKTEVSRSNLESALKAEADKNANSTVVLKMDKSASVEELIKIVDIVNKAKIPMVIATEKSKS